MARKRKSGNAGSAPSTAELANTISELRQMYEKQSKQIVQMEAKTRRIASMLSITSGLKKDVTELAYIIWLAIRCSVVFAINMCKAFLVFAVAIGLGFVAMGVFHYVVPFFTDDILRPILHAIKDVANAAISAVNVIGGGISSVVNFIGGRKTMKKPKIKHIGMDIFGKTVDQLIHLRTRCRSTDSMSGVFGLFMLGVTRNDLCPVARVFHFIPLAHWIPLVLYLGDDHAYNPYKSNCNFSRVRLCLMYSSQHIIWLLIFVFLGIIALISYAPLITHIFYFVISHITTLVHFIASSVFRGSSPSSAEYAKYVKKKWRHLHHEGLWGDIKE